MSKRCGALIVVNHPSGNFCFASRIQPSRQNCSALPPVSLSGEGLGGGLPRLPAAAAAFLPPAEDSNLYNQILFTLIR